MEVQVRGPEDFNTALKILKRKVQKDGYQNELRLRTNCPSRRARKKQKRWISVKRRNKRVQRLEKWLQLAE